MGHTLDPRGKRLTGQVPDPYGTVMRSAENRRAPAETATTRGTVLFADLRGYTRLAERLSPCGVVALLDEFFDVLGAATAINRGEVFHMAGDGMMAGFGLDRSACDGAREALAAGKQMLKEFAWICDRWRRELSLDAGIGVGLHLGEVAVGLLGPPGNKVRTLVGDTVNVAARLCARARAGELLLSAAVADALDAEGHSKRVPEPTAFLHLPRFALRGRSAPLDIWCMPATRRLAV